MTAQAYTGPYPIHSHRTLADADRGGATPMIIEATLPLPPSTNELFANARRGRVKTATYRAWCEEAAYHLRRAWSALGKPEIAAQPMRLHIELGLTDRRRDASNCIKAIEDLLVATLPVPDDRWNDEGRWKRNEAIPGLARIRLEPLNTT